MFVLFILMLQLCCSSGVLGMKPPHGDTHTMSVVRPRQQQSSSSSSFATTSSSSRSQNLCSSSLTPAAAAHIANSLAGDPRIHVTGVSLTGNCGAAQLMAVPSTGANSSYGSGGATTSSNSNSNGAGSSTAAAQAALLLVSASSDSDSSAQALASAAAAASIPQTVNSVPINQSSGAAVQLHIDFSVSGSAPFFSDIVMQYSSFTSDDSVYRPVGSSSSSNTAARPSIWIQPVGDRSARQVVTHDLIGQPQGRLTSSSSSRHGHSNLPAPREQGLDAWLQSVPALSQVGTVCMCVCVHAPQHVQVGASIIGQL